MSTDQLFSRTHPTPVGELTLIASDAGLRAIFWPRSSTKLTSTGRHRRKPDHPILQQTATQLDEYFERRT